MKKILPGQPWGDVIMKAMADADFVSVVFSKNSVNKKGYVQKEFKFALDLLDHIPEDQIFIIPV